MKLNYRDRIVLTAVIVILVWVAGVMLFIKPAIENLQDSQAALDDAKVTLSELKERNKKDENLPERIKAERLCLPSAGARAGGPLRGDPRGGAHRRVAQLGTVCV